MRFGFIGSAYASQSPLVSAEALVNWYLEGSESPNARVAQALYPDPGLSLDGNLGAALPSVRGAGIFQGRTFFVSGTHLVERTGAGAYTDYGAFGGNNFITDDGLPAMMVAGGTVGGAYPSQLLICSGGALTVFSLVSNTFQALTTPPTNVSVIEFIDGLFIALSTGGASINTFSVSNPEDATTWPGLSVAQVSVFSDQLLSMIASNRLLWVFGAKRAVVYYNSGAPIFPFDVASGGFLEVGIAAQFSVARLATKSGTTIGWLGGDERGANVVYVANGFTPQRVSDHALEYWMSQQANVTDAVGMGREDQGHYWYDIWFPTANATWTLDLDNGQWHRRSSLVNGVQGAHLGRCHVAAFGTHLVGSRTNGNVYQMSINFLSENVDVGVFNPIIRTRIGPTVMGESLQKPVPINDFEVQFETGLGPQPPLQYAATNVADSFNRANQDPIGAPWSGAKGSVQLLNNAVSPSSVTSLASIILYNTQISGDQTVQASLKQLTATRGYVALVFRADALINPKNYYYLNLDASPGFGGIGIATPLNLQKVINGVVQVPLPHQFGYVTPQIGDVFQVQIKGTDISVFQNGNLIGTFIDPSPLHIGPYIGLFLQPIGTGVVGDLAWGNFQSNNLPQSRDPYAMFSYSPDFGKTWGPERMIPCGQAGNFRVSAIDRRLGVWESWTPRVTCSDPISWRITDAIINQLQDQTPRLAKQYAKIT
jgi:hypothetical protein